MTLPWKFIAKQYRLKFRCELAGSKKLRDELVRLKTEQAKMNLVFMEVLDVTRLTKLPGPCKN